MQTAKSSYTKAAKSTTKMEFQDNIRDFWAPTRTTLQQRGLTPRISYDNNKIQKNADLGQMGVLPEERVPLAPYMPDGHKVIEHVFARAKYKLVEQVYSLGSAADRITAADAQQMVKDVISMVTTPAQIRADVDSLPLTYEVIARPRGQLFQSRDGKWHRGTGGDWPPKIYR
jgi:hypothetical protein